MHVFPRGAFALQGSLPLPPAMNQTGMDQATGPDGTESVLGWLVEWGEHIAAGGALSAARTCEAPEVVLWGHV